MINRITKTSQSLLYQPPDQEITTPAYEEFKSDTSATLTSAGYAALKISVYGGLVDFDYNIYNTAFNGGSGFQFDAYGNLIQTLTGWICEFFTQIGGVFPASVQIPDSYSTVPLGGAIVNHPAETNTVSFEPFYKDFAITGWNGGGIGEQWLTDVIQLEFKSFELNRGAICGITADEIANNDQGYIEILYGFYCYGTIYKIIESGNLIGSPTAFLSTDVFKIVLTADWVQYYVNDILISVSDRYDNYSTFRADCSLYYSGDNIIDSAISSSPAIEFFGGGNLRFTGIGFENNDKYSQLNSGKSSGQMQFSGGGTIEDIFTGGGNIQFTGIGFESNSLFSQSNSAANGGLQFDGGGDIGLIIPPKVFGGGGYLRMYGFGFIETGYIVGQLIELPTFAQTGGLIVEKQINFRKYYCTITGANDGLDDVIIPIESIQASLSNAGASTVTVVVPDGVTWATAITDRSNGTIIINVLRGYSDGSTEDGYTNEFAIDGITPSQGANSYSVVITGRYHLTRIGGFTLDFSTNDKGQSFLGVNNGKRHIRSYIGKTLMPGDTIIPPYGGQFVVGRITWNINPQVQYMDVTEA